jgi:hypothetical protein
MALSSEARVPAATPVCPVATVSPVQGTRDLREIAARGRRSEAVGPGYARTDTRNSAAVRGARVHPRTERRGCGGSGVAPAARAVSDQAWFFATFRGTRASCLVGSARIDPAAVTSRGRISTESSRIGHSRLRIEGAGRRTCLTAAAMSGRPFEVVVYPTDRVPGRGSASARPSRPGAVGPPGDRVLRGDGPCAGGDTGADLSSMKRTGNRRLDVTSMLASGPTFDPAGGGRASERLALTTRPFGRRCWRRFPALVGRYGSLRGGGRPDVGCTPRFGTGCARAFGPGRCRTPSSEWRARGFARLRR